MHTGSVGYGCALCDCLCGCRGELSLHACFVHDDIYFECRQCLDAAFHLYVERWCEVELNGVYRELTLHKISSFEQLTCCPPYVFGQC